MKIKMYFDPNAPQNNIRTASANSLCFIFYIKPRNPGTTSKQQQHQTAALSHMFPRAKDFRPLAADDELPALDPPPLPHFEDKGGS
jgi:hypothetical protein